MKEFVKDCESCAFFKLGRCKLKKEKVESFDVCGLFLPLKVGYGNHKY